MAAKPLVQAAIDYRSERGWNVIPLRRDEKVPLEGFPLSTFLQRPMTDEELTSWFRHPDAGNIGVLAGPTSGVWVADIDDTGLVEDFRNAYPSDLMSRTPSGGLHLFYEYPADGVGVPNGHIGNGIDIISKGKYVLISPSFVKKAGHGGVSVSGSYEWLQYGRPSAAKDELLRAAMTGEVGSISGINNISGVHGLTSNTSNTSSAFGLSNINRAEAERLLSYAMRTGKFIEGRHNETIYYGALILSSDGMGTELISELMLGLDRRDPTPQGDRAVRAAVHNAVRVANKRREEDELAGYRIVVNSGGSVSPNTDPALTSVAGMQVLPANAAMQQAGIAGKTGRAVTTFNTLTYEQASQEYEGYVTRWLVEGFLLEESVMMVAAPPERFKTWLTADLAVSVATGGLFLGQFPVQKTGDVLVVQQEDFGARLINRYNKIERSKTRYMDTPGFKAEPQPDGSIRLTTEYNPEFNTIHFHTEGALKLDDPVSLEAFKAKVREVKPALVVIDPFYSLSNKTDDYYASLADTIRKHIKDLRNEVGCAIVFVHHTGKGSKEGDDPTNRQGAWGSQFINAVMEGMIMLARTKGMGENSVSVYRRFKDAPAQPVIDLTFHIKEGAEDGVEYEVELNTASSLENEVKQYLLEQGPSKLADLYEEFSDRIPSKPQLTNWLKEVDGIVKQSRGVYALSPDVQLDV